MIFYPVLLSRFEFLDNYNSILKKLHILDTEDRKNCQEMKEKYINNQELWKSCNPSDRFGFRCFAILSRYEFNKIIEYLKIKNIKLANKYLNQENIKKCLERKDWK